MKNRTFVLNDESVNAFGFWIKTAGIDLSLFKKNPVMLWNHNHAWNGSKDEVLPTGRWENIRIEDDRLLADAVFDANDDFAKKIAGKVEAGILNMCSMGFQVMEESMDETYVKQGQTRSTVTKCLLREVSIVDIGANRNAVALYDTAGEIIELSDGGDCPVPLLKKANFNQKNMKLITLKLGLPESAAENEIIKAVEKLQEDAKKSIELQDQVAAAKKELHDFKSAIVSAQIKALLEKGMSERKLTKELADNLEKDYAGNLEGLKKLVDAMQPQTLVTAPADPKTPTGLPEKYKGKSFNELYLSGDLEGLKADCPDYYETLKSKK